MYFANHSTILNAECCDYTCLVNDLYYIYGGDAVRFPAIIILLIATRLKVMDLRWLILSTALVVDLSIQGWSLMSQTQCIINAVFLCACSSVHSTTIASIPGRVFAFITVR